MYRLKGIYFLYSPQLGITNPSLDQDLNFVELCTTHEVVQSFWSIVFFPHSLLTFMGSFNSFKQAFLAVADPGF